MLNFLRRKNSGTQQSVAPSSWSRAKARVKKMILFGILIVIFLAGIYLAGILTVIEGPRHFGFFTYAIWPGEVVEVVRVNQEYTKPWFGGNTVAHHWLYVRRPEWITEFPFIAVGDEMKFRPGDLVCRANSGRFLKLSSAPNPKDAEVASISLVLPPPPKGLAEAVEGLIPLELSDEDKKLQAEYAKRPKSERWDAMVTRAKVRFSKTPEVLYEGEPR